MTFQTDIDATHPANDDAPDSYFDADALAMQLVHERHEKRDLVDLVRWLILRQPHGLLPGPRPMEPEPILPLDPGEDPHPELSKWIKQKALLLSAKANYSTLRVGGNGPGINLPNNPVQGP